MAYGANGWRAGVNSVKLGVMKIIAAIKRGVTLVMASGSIGVWRSSMAA